MSFLKSRAFLAFAGIGGTIGAAIAYDRWRVREILNDYRQRAAAIGEQPANEPLKKMLILMFAEDPNHLRKQRLLFRKYSVELLTLAGCDYKLLAFDALSLDREVDKLVPVPEGVLPSNDHPIPRVVTVETFFGPLLSWSAARGPSSGKAVDVSLPEPTEDALAQVRRSKLEGAEPMLSSTADGIVVGSRHIFALVADAPMRLIDRATLVNFDQPQSIGNRIYQFFNRRQVAEQIASSTLQAVMKCQ